MKIPAANGLMVAYLLVYDAREQQWFYELAYSWDGLERKRLPGHPAWIPRGMPGD